MRNKNRKKETEKEKDNLIPRATVILMAEKRLEPRTWVPVASLHAPPPLVNDVPWGKKSPFTTLTPPSHSGQIIGL